MLCSNLSPTLRSFPKFCAHSYQHSSHPVYHMVTGLDSVFVDFSLLPRFAARADCGCTYHLRVQLASADYIVLASFEPPPVTIEQWSDARWQEVRPRLLVPPLTLPKPGPKAGPKEQGAIVLQVSMVSSSLLCRSPTPSLITLPASVTSFFNMEAWTLSSGKAGTGPGSLTAVSSSATGQPRTLPLPECYQTL